MQAWLLEMLSEDGSELLQPRSFHVSRSAAMQAMWQADWPATTIRCNVVPGNIIRDADGRLIWSQDKIGEARYIPLSD